MNPLYTQKCTPSERMNPAKLMYPPGMQFWRLNNVNSQFEGEKYGNQGNEGGEIAPPPHPKGMLFSDLIV